MKGKMRKILTAATVGLLCLSMSFPALAATKEDTKKRIEQLENEKSALEDKLSELKEKKPRPKIASKSWMLSLTISVPILRILIRPLKISVQRLK